MIWSKDKPGILNGKIKTISFIDLIVKSKIPLVS